MAAGARMHRLLTADAYNYNTRDQSFASLYNIMYTRALDILI